MELSLNSQFAAFLLIMTGWYAYMYLMANLKKSDDSLFETIKFFFLNYNKRMIAKKANAARDSKLINNQERTAYISKISDRFNQTFLKPQYKISDKNVFSHHYPINNSDALIHLSTMSMNGIYKHTLSVVHNNEVMEYSLTNSEYQLFYAMMAYKMEQAERRYYQLNISLALPDYDYEKYQDHSSNYAKHYPKAS